LPRNGRGTSIAILDTGPLFAIIDDDDPNHARAQHAVEGLRTRLVIPTMVVAETTYFVGTRLGPRAESRFIRSLAEFDVEAPTPADFVRMAELVEQYADFPLGGTDASVVALAERLGAETIVTLDRRHFGRVRPRHVGRFVLLPD
jgi:predicted nucleic acid-binding protein